MLADGVRVMYERVRVFSGAKGKELGSQRYIHTALKNLIATPK